MTIRFWRALALAALTGTAATAAAPSPDVPPRAHPNDNRSPAGTLRDGVLRLSLDVRSGRWFPEADDGPFIDAPMFAEAGRAPQVPAPLIRVPAGTSLEVTVRNTLTDSTVTVFGLTTRPAAGLDSLALPPGTSRTVRFAAGAPGTYAYWARVGVVPDAIERDQAGGAFIVDETDTRPDDRVFVMNVWGEPNGKAYRNAVTVNGKAWPYTERLDYTVGDSVHWRWVNANERNHPMHLHGFYFRVDSRGTPLQDSLYAPTERRQAVTEELQPRETMTLAWSPVRPGNWLFHCHIAFHVVMETARLAPPGDREHDPSHMAGLVLGITVRPGADWREPARRDPRALTFTVAELPRHRDSSRTVGVSIVERGSGGTYAPPQSPGPVLFATRDQPTDVTVINRLSETTAIHWHGLELESYSDGVVRWSGAGTRLAPAIAPGDSFTARLTLRRAGTFIYHTHVHDLSQLTAGLYGAIVVLEPGERPDPATDHVFVVGWDGPEEPPRLVVNGDTTAPPLELVAGRTHRLRFVNIGPAQRVRLSVLRDSMPATWRPLAKDGADLPAAQSTERPAAQLVRVGETFDVALTLEPGAYDLVMMLPQDRRVLYHRALRVR